MNVLTDSRQKPFGVVFTGDADLVSKAHEIAANYTPDFFDTLPSYTRRRLETTPWALDRTRTGGEPLFVFLTRDAFSHRLVVPGADGASTTMEPVDLLPRLAEDPRFRALDAGPFNRPLVLMMDCLDPTNVAATRRAAVEILKGQRAYRGYRRMYYPHGMFSLLDTPVVEMTTGEFRLVEQPSHGDLRISRLPAERGIRLPLPGDPADLSTDLGALADGDFVICVAGDGHRVWPGTRHGRRVELDGATFAGAVANHPDMKKVLAGPAEIAIVLGSPHAGDRDEAGATGYDFAAGLQPLYADRPVRAVVGVNETTDVGPNKAARIHAIELVSASLSLLCVVFPDVGEDFYVPPPAFDEWIGMATVASLGMTSTGLRSPWAGRRPALVRFHSRDGLRLSVRHVREDHRDAIEVPVDEAPGLMLTTKAFRDLVAAVDDSGPVLILVPPWFDTTAATNLARGIKRELYLYGFRRTVHTLIGASPTPEGELTPYNLVAADPVA